MERKNIKTLMLLEAIGREKSYSQRDLARKLNISLGLVNKLIKELTNQGVIKSTNHINSRVEYSLTPKGIAKKTSLSIQQIAQSINSYKKIKRMIRERLVELKASDGNSLVFYGTGELCEIACLLLSHYDHNKLKIVDDEKAGKNICGFKIYKEEDISNMVYDGVIIMELGKNSSIRHKLIAKGVPSNKVFTVFPKENSY